MNKFEVLQDLIRDMGEAEKGMSTKFSAVEMESALRAAIVDIFGTDKITAKELRRPEAYKFFEVIETYIMNRTSETLEKELQIAEYKNVGWGDKNEFILENPELFDVLVTAVGNGNVRRQRIEDGSVSISTEPRIIRIFENFKRFMAGRTNWTLMIEKVAQSYVKSIKEEVWAALYGAVSAGGSTVYNVAEVGGAVDLDNLDELIDHVQAANNGVDVVLMGTKAALRKIVGTTVAEVAIEDVYKTGVYQFYNGTPMLPIAQMHLANSDTFALDNETVFVLPMGGEKMVKIVEEGEAIIGNFRPEDNIRGDMSAEYVYYREVGVGIVTATKFGKYTW